jgi:predicted transcriptional regulator
MLKRLSYNAAMYGPQEHKSFAGALDAFLRQECPQVGGKLSRQVLVQSLVDMVSRFYPETSHLKPGQTTWTTVHKDTRSSYGRKIADCPLTSVVLDLVLPGDVKDRSEGRKLREIKRDAAARLFQQAFAQEGCMTLAEVAILLKVSVPSVSKYAREWEQLHGKILPRRGTIHDMGPTLTHKKEIVRKLFLEGKSVEQVQRETDHSPEAIHRYIQAFKQVLLCKRKQLNPQETSFAVKMSQRLVQEYLNLIAEYGEENPYLKALLQENQRSARNN